MCQALRRWEKTAIHRFALIRRWEYLDVERCAICKLDALFNMKSRENGKQSYIVLGAAKFNKSQTTYNVWRGHGAKGVLPNIPF